MSVTSLSPAHHPVFNVFGDYFWSSDRNITEGVNVLYEASKVSLNNTKQLTELFQEHLEMERDYNKRLKKLSDKVRSVSDDKNTMAPIWKNLSTMYTSMSEMHSQYLKELSLTHKSISSYSSEEKKNSNSLSKQWEQANSLKQHYNKSFQQYSTSKSQFYIVSQSVQKSNHLEVGSNGSTEHPEQEGELVRSQEEYKSSVSKHSSSVQQTVDKLFSIFVEFECFEKQRFSKICGIIQEFLCVFSKFFVRVSKITEGTGESVKAIENSKESILIDFASRYGTKGHRPISPCYDDPPNVAELETELGPRPIYRSPSAQSIESDKSKPETPKSKRSHKVGNKYDQDKKKAKSKNFLKKKSKTQPESEPSTLNPNFNPEQSLSLSKTPSPVDTLLPGFVLDEDGYRVRIDDGGTSPQPHSRSSSSSTDTDVENNTSADVLRNMHINQPKSLLDASNDNTEDLYKLIDKMKLGAPHTNLSSRKSNSANQLTQGTDSSIENLLAPLRQKNTNIGDVLLASTSYTKRQSSAPRQAEWDQDSEPDRTRTPTPVDPTQDGIAFPQLSGLDPYTFSNDLSTPRINAKLSIVPPLSKEDDFTFTNNFSNPADPDNMTPTISKNPLTFSTSSPSFIPLSPPVVALPPPIVIRSPPTNSLLRNKPASKLSIGNRMVQIIPESEFDSPTHSAGSNPQSPEQIIRPDSSMSFTSEIARGSSPGSDTMPIALSLEETIHVLYKQNQLTEQFVRLGGKLKIAFLSNNIDTLHQSNLVFVMEGDNLITDKFKCVEETLLSREGEEFYFKMEPLKEYLLKQRASTPGKSFTVLEALGYSVKIPVTAPPLLLTVTWDPDSRTDQTVVDIQYKYNPDGFPILSPYPLENVVFSVNYGSKISEVELEPVGHHVKPNYKVIWKRDMISSQINSTGKFTAIFTHLPDLKLPHVVEVSFKANHTLSSTQVKLKRPGFNIAKTKRNLSSGVYKSEN
ncbi:F-BAR domain only protein 2-like [Oopsacas minuta]|uniref:F-BAR domain only protein 2-like n=1 Tax=Oopsacas minuta TaxID=111878 RepID=A0AAV7JCE2_9METZ|nr:F-BAR domain only protein 2-like [Oopsacas minuta]